MDMPTTTGTAMNITIAAKVVIQSISFPSLVDGCRLSGCLGSFVFCPLRQPSRWSEAVRFASTAALQVARWFWQSVTIRFCWLPALISGLSAFQGRCGRLSDKLFMGLSHSTCASACALAKLCCRSRAAFPAGLSLSIWLRPKPPACRVAAAANSDKPCIASPFNAQQRVAKHCRASPSNARPIEAFASTTPRFAN